MDVRPGYKMTEVGVIPEDWEVSKVGYVVDLLTGFPFPSSGYSQSGVRLLRGSNVKRARVDWSDDLTAYWHSVTADIRKYVLESGDIVVAMDGSLVGRSFAALCDADVPALLLQRVARIRSKIVDVAYLKFWICSKPFTEHCGCVKTTTAIPHISPADIRSFRVAIPSTKAEQSAIATALSDTDALIESLEKLITKKRQIKKGAMQELLTGERRLPGFTGEWEVRCIDEIAECYDNLRVPLNDAQRIKMKGDYPYCGANGVLDFIDNYCVDDSVILIAEDGGYFDEYMTRPIAYRMSGRFWVNNHAHILKSKLDFDQDFLFYSLVHKNILSFLASGTRAKLNKSELNRIVIKQPTTKAEQTAIATILSKMDVEITALEAKCAKAQQIKQGMMHELLTGRIRLVEPKNRVREASC